MMKNKAVSRYIGNGINETLAEKLQKINKEKLEKIKRGEEEITLKKLQMRKEAYVLSLEKLALRHYDISEHDLKNRFNEKELELLADTLYSLARKSLRWRFPLCFSLTAALSAAILPFMFYIPMFNDLFNNKEYEPEFFYVTAQYMRFWQNHKWFKENFDYKNIYVA